MLSLFLFFLVIFLVLLFLGAFWRTPWLPTKEEDYTTIAELAGLREGINFYDLGSGTGEMLFYFSKKYNANCFGIEISPLLYLYSKIKSLFQKKVKIFYGDFFHYDLSKADVVFIFGHPKVYRKLRKKFIKELKNETKIIVACWPLENARTLSVKKGKSGVNYYLYKKTSLLGE
jgi:SAM-dependent methyltransferase